VQHALPDDAGDSAGDRVVTAAARPRGWAPPPTLEQYRRAAATPERRVGGRLADHDVAATAAAPIVSVVTVVWNAAATLPRTIASVREQRSAVDLEYIVVDGGSTDGTQALIDTDDVDLWISERDAGIYDAMNKGVALARGDIVVLINADDWLLPGALTAVCQRFAERPECGVVYGDVIIDAAGDQPSVRFRPPARLAMRNWHTIPIPHAATMLRRAVYERVGLFRTDLRLAGDFELLLRAFTAGERFEYLPRPLAGVARGGRSDTQHGRHQSETRRTIAAYELGGVTRLLHLVHLGKWWLVHVAEQSGAGRGVLTVYRTLKSFARTRGGSRP
jgi:glycosyltransferase involved in cell wall biosynthesis